MFSRQVIPESTCQALGFAAGEIALGIKRKQAEAALSLSELKFRNIFENSQVGICRTRPEDGLILEANQRFAEIIGYTAATDLIGHHSIREFYIDPVDCQRIVDEIRMIGELRNREVHMLRRDGSHLWGLLSIRPNREENCLEAVITDISDRRRLEEKLRQSQKFLHTIVENLPLALFTKDVNNDFRYELINKSSERILGFSRTGAIGRNDYELLPKELADCYRDQDLAAVEQEKLLEFSEHLSVVKSPGEDMLCGDLSCPCSMTRATPPI